MLAFIGDSNKDNCIKFWNLLTDVVGDSLKFTNCKPIVIPFSNTNSVYVLIDNEVCEFENREHWIDIKPIAISDIIGNKQIFRVGDKVITKSDQKERTITNIEIGKQSGNIIYYFGDTTPGCYSDELFPAPEDEIVAWKCEYCGKVLRSKKPHLCDGHYRCNRLRFSPIREDLGYIEIPKGYKFGYVEGNKIRLVKDINESE